MDRVQRFVALEGRVIRPESVMTLPRSAADVLAGHVLFEIEVIDRMYLNLYQPRWQHGAGIAAFFAGHRGHRFASSALMAPMTAAFTADIAEQFQAALTMRHHGPSGAAVPKECTHPVLLCLHGGLPEYLLTERYPTGLENDFTVVWWEQRGAGLSYGPGIPPETMTSEQFIADTLAVTGYLRNRFGKEKITITPSVTIWQRIIQKD